MSEVLLTVSGRIDPDAKRKVEAGERPRLDYLELAARLNAELLDHAAAQQDSGILGWCLQRLGGKNALLAWTCFRRRSSVRIILTDGEQVGLPLSLLLKLFGRGPLNVRHVMIGHSLSTRKKAFFLARLGLTSHVDRFLVYASAQQRLLRDRYHVAPERIILTPFQVDISFFSPSAPELASEETQGAGPPPLICAAGLERRDYQTLVQAVDGLPVRLVITASSAWSKQASTATGVRLPDNVLVRSFSFAGLRQLYRDASLVVMPLMDVDFAAGVTTILEAMAMQRAVVCSRVIGQTDVVVEGATGVYVPVGDVQSLRSAITRLLDDPERAKSMGKRGYELVHARMSLDHYVERIRLVLAELAPDAPPSVAA